jgi:hypothetical protein
MDRQSVAANSAPARPQPKAFKGLPSLGAANLALVSAYLAPTWGMEAFQALTSPFGGIDVRAHVAAANFFRHLFAFGLDGLMRTSSILAGAKLVIAAGCVAYLIEFARACAARREPDRETMDVVLLLALVAVVVWSLPVFVSDDIGFINLRATQLLLVAGAGVLIVIERHIEQTATGGHDEAHLGRAGIELDPRRGAGSGTPAPHW